MKKMRLKTKILLILTAVILFVPIPSFPANDGGTTEYRAMTYTIVRWHKILPTSDANGKADMYVKTSFYGIPHNFKDLDELWEMEMVKD